MSLVHCTCIQEVVLQPLDHLFEVLVLLYFLRSDSLKCSEEGRHFEIQTFS